ncbi:MAG: SH3 domain-containing protein [Candidatus Symbiothrix sp.]|jgi:uncharacterized protein YraI|nr:SH3 domain-containing protein [Candidatus Symbiothrix sp.]
MATLSNKAWTPATTIKAGASNRKSVTIFGAVMLLLFCCIAQPMSGAEKYTVTSTTLNVRSGAGGAYSKIGSLAQNETVEVLEISNNWAKIQYKDRTGYVSMDYLQKQVAAQNITSTEYSKAMSSSDWQPLITIIFVLVLLLMFLGLGRWDEGTFAFICEIALPVLCLIYFLFAPNEMFFVSPDTVGWFWTIVNGVLLVYLSIRICATVKTVFEDLMENWSNIFLWFLLMLYLGAAIAIGFDAVWAVIVGAVLGFFAPGQGLTRREEAEFWRTHPDIDWDSGSSGGRNNDYDTSVRHTINRESSRSNRTTSKSVKSGSFKTVCAGCYWNKNSNCANPNSDYYHNGTDDEMTRIHCDKHL